jgi:RecA-family ATPase
MFLSLKELDEFVDVKTEYLVDGLIPENGFVLMRGESGDGKSFIALELALKISIGEKFLGRDTNGKSKVVWFITSESQKQHTSRRLQHSVKYNGYENKLNGLRFVFIENEEYSRLEIEKLGKEIRNAEQKPDLIIIDSLFTFVQEEKDVDFVNDKLKSFINHYGVSFLVVENCVCLDPPFGLSTVYVKKHDNDILIKSKDSANLHAELIQFNNNECVLN